MIKNHTFKSTLLLSALALSGCMTVDKLSHGVEDKFSRTAKLELPQKTVVEVPNARPEPVGRSIDAIDERQAVNIEVNNASLYEISSHLASRVGYGLSLTADVDARKLVTMKLKSPSPLQAIRQLAWHSGYVAVVNNQDKSVTIAKEATMVFRVPGDDLKRILTTTFKYGGSPVGGGSGGGGGGGGGGAASGTAFTPATADFAVEGTYGNAPNAFQAFVEDIAGSNAKVQVYLEAGMVSVRGNGQALKRVHDFLSRYAYDARRQIEVNARVVEVSLSNDFKYGIQWDKVLNAADPLKRFTFNSSSVLAGGAGVTPSASFSFSGNSVTGIIEALESMTTVEVTSTPQLVIANNSSGVIFEGMQKPYLPSVTETTTGSGESATKTKSGSGAYAADGVQMSIFANILDDENATLTIVPNTVALGNLHKFLDDNIQMYEQSIRNGGQRISIRSGETVVISGNRYTKGNKLERGIPGMTNAPLVGHVLNGRANDSSARQTVIIMSAKVLRPDPMDIIFSESI